MEKQVKRQIGAFAEKPLGFLLALILLALASCATSVRFEVEHPPIVDLRGVNSITVIPIERGSARALEYLSEHLTSALVAGIRDNALRGNLIFVEPQALAHVSQHDLWRHVDVLVTGRIANIHSSDNVRESTRTIRGEDYTVIAVTLTVTVEIEYSYIRARDGRVLGTFRKTQRATDTAEHLRRRPHSGSGNRPGGGRPGGGQGGPNHGHWNHPDWNRPGPWDNPGWFNPDRDRGSGRGRRGGRSGIASVHRHTWEESLARVAISRFSRSMDREIAPWVTKEERSLRRRSGNEPELDEARMLVRLGRYDQALLLYREIYEQHGNVLAGFNTAILFAANDQFAESLELLEALQRGLLASGQSTPRFIRREIEIMSGFVNGFRVLEEFRAGRIGAMPGVSMIIAPPTPLVRVYGREARGTVNLNLVKIYALSEAITYVEDSSIWSKIVASADTDPFEGRWSMRIPDTAPSLLWFVVADRHNLYITPSPLSTFEAVVLNTAQMIRLESL
ncbi:MAG: tetratricopeptide repeat protein [Treponema sp.]|nr:tetratricopeptide repeat protein [Treponema sp.]